VARPASIGGSLTPSGNGLAVTVIVQHRLSPRAMSMLANVSRMYAECFDKVLYHVNSRILKCKMTNVITLSYMFEPSSLQGHQLGDDLLKFADGQ